MLNSYTHLSFQARWTLDGNIQNLIGQCQAWVAAMLGTPIRPDFRQRLLTLSLARGAQATTAIEGNTLSTAEVEAIQAGNRLPGNKGYLEHEVRNILGAFNTLMDELIFQKRDELISPDLIKRMHHMVGEGLGDAFKAAPGELRRSNVHVGTYRPPSFGEVENLVSRLCDWLDGEVHFRSGQDFEVALVESIVAHVYLEWIHPFGDGNGRTGRLLEFYILMRAGLPNIASHLLSNHYNQSREEYYRQIDEAARTNDLSAFIAYAVTGLRDGLEEVFETIQASLFTISWENYIHDRVGELRAEGRNDGTIRRLRILALAIPPDRVVPFRDLIELNPKIAKEYANKSKPTLSRDLASLVELGLILKTEAGCTANAGVLKGYVPVSTGRIS